MHQSCNVPLPRYRIKKICLLEDGYEVSIRCKDQKYKAQYKASQYQQE